MNSSQFMDKQIMGLTAGSKNNKDFIDLMNPEEESKKEEIVPSYDFQPIRPIVSYSPELDGASRPWNSADPSRINSSPVRNYDSVGTTKPAKAVLDKDKNDYEASIVSEIDRTMKKHADNLLHSLEGISTRLLQLEGRTRHLENSVDDLKISVGENHGSTDERLRLFENLLREVQTGVQHLKDNHENVEAQLQLAKLQLQVPKVEQQAVTQTTGYVDSPPQAASSPQQYQQQHFPPPSAIQLPSVSSLPPPPPQLPPQNPPPQVQLPNQVPQNHMPAASQRESYFQSQEGSLQPHQLPPTQQPQPHPPQPYPPAPPQHYSQPPQQLPSASHHPEEPSYASSQNYPPNLRQPLPPPRPPATALPSLQFYGSASTTYEPPPSSAATFSSGYGPPVGPRESYPYGGPTSHYGGSSTMKPQPPLSSSTLHPRGGGSGYPQLPTARILPRALPTASDVNDGSGSGGSGNRVSADDVVERVASMGFSREQVRAAVRKLTENGQSVDVNVVLDKLTNDGGIEPVRGWLGR